MKNLNQTAGPLTRRNLLRSLACAIPLAFESRLSAYPIVPAFDEQSFEFIHEFYGPDGYTDPQAAANLQNRLNNGLTLYPPIDAGFTSFVSQNNAALVLNLAGSAVPGRLPVSYIERQRTALADIAASNPDRRVIWSLMAEWDQSGGAWVPNGRPRYRGLSKSDAYNKFLNYYRNTCQPLTTYLGQPASGRSYLLGAITDYSPNAIYAYELGVDICLLERAIDELGDLATGIAYVRGAARQSNRQWGIDISTWRTSNNSATEFDDNGVLIGGWSPSYLKRHYYASFMSGAHIVQNEATVYYDRFNRLNPFGVVTRDFANFALVRHPDNGRTQAYAALLVDHLNGFDPKHGPYNQADSVWYQDIPYSEGDSMINNLLRTAYPNHWLHGLTPGAPFNDASGLPVADQFRAFLARGGDSRPYEPMPSTRWGDSFDFITNRATVDTLNRYRVIMLTGDVTPDAALGGALQTWVLNGGLLVINARQASWIAPQMLGVTVSAEIRTAAGSTWLPDGTVYNEKTYRYNAVTATTATVIATTPGGDPVVTSNVYGKGEVVFTSAHYMQSSARDQLLSVGAKTIDWLDSRFSTARVSGSSAIHYIVNQAPGRVIVTLINNGSYEWSGTVSTAGSSVTAVREYCADVDLPSTVGAGQITSNIRVPAYDVRVCAFEF